MTHIIVSPPKNCMCLSSQCVLYTDNQAGSVGRVYGLLLGCTCVHALLGICTNASRVYPLEYFVYTLQFVLSPTLRSSASPMQTQNGCLSCLSIFDGVPCLTVEPLVYSYSGKKKFKKRKRSFHSHFQHSQRQASISIVPSKGVRRISQSPVSAFGR